MNQKDLTLAPRLEMCANFVRSHARLCDVGTDHGYLPVALVLRGKIEAALACDIRENPLHTAQAHIAQYGVSAQVQTRLSDGLAAVSPQEVDDVVIAGMGGDLIARIVTETTWLRAPAKRLILQPMTKAFTVRHVLADLGFALRREQAVLDSNRPYTVMLYEFAPTQATLSSLQLYTGLLDPQEAAARRYLSRVATYLRKRSQGLRREGQMAQAEEMGQLCGLLENWLRAEEDMT